MNYTSPLIAPATNEPVIIEINARISPLLISALEKYKAPAFWASEADYQNALQQICSLQEAILTGAQGINERLDRIYRLMDTTFNGTQYTANGDVITPAIPAVPPASTDEPNAVRAHIGRLWQLGENAATGRTFAAGAGIQNSPALPEDLSWLNRLLSLQGTTGGFFGFGEEPVQLRDLLQAGRINTTEDEGLIDNGIEEILNAVSQGSNIGSAISSFLGTAANAATDGGVIAVQLATSAAILAQLQRINVALNGNPTLQENNNILFALSGDNLVTSTNNVLSLLGRGLFDTQDSTSLADFAAGTNFGIGQIMGRIGAGAGASSVNGQLSTLIAAVNALSTLVQSGNVDAGAATTLQLQLLECICEAVNGPPTLPTYPDPADYACLPNYPTYVLQGQVTFNADGQGSVTWIAQPGAEAAGVFVAQGNSGFGVTGGRNLCFSLVWPEGENAPPGGAGGNFAPYTTSGEGDPARPTLVYTGGVRQTVGTFWNISSDELRLIAYALGISLAGGVTTNLAARIYVYAGAFG